MVCMQQLSQIWDRWFRDALQYVLVWCGRKQCSLIQMIKGMQLSETAITFLAVLIKHAYNYTAIMNPTQATPTNSCFQVWLYCLHHGRRNRSPLVRVPASHDMGTRLGHQFVGNKPYTLLWLCFWKLVYGIGSKSKHQLLSKKTSTSWPKSAKRSWNHWPPICSLQCFRKLWPKMKIVKDALWWTYLYQLLGSQTDRVGKLAQPLFLLRKW